jgi:hypothetical protein
MDGLLDWIVTILGIKLLGRYFFEGVDLLFQRKFGLASLSFVMAALFHCPTGVVCVLLVIIFPPAAFIVYPIVTTLLFSFNVTAVVAFSSLALEAVCAIFRFFSGK